MTVRAQFTAITARNVNQIDPNTVEDLIFFADTWAEDLVKRMQVYPPYESRYVRTFRLQGNWHARVRTIGGAYTVFVENATPYGPYVQGSRQWFLHAEHGWITLQQAIDRPAFVNGCKNIMNKAVARR